MFHDGELREGKLNACDGQQHSWKRKHREAIALR